MRRMRIDGASACTYELHTLHSSGRGHALSIFDVKALHALGRGRAGQPPSCSRRRPSASSVITSGNRAVGPRPPAATPASPTTSFLPRQGCYSVLRTRSGSATETQARSCITFYNVANGNKRRRTITAPVQERFPGCRHQHITQGEIKCLLDSPQEGQRSIKQPETPARAVTCSTHI
ncbi:hypothetical protein EVAR_36862_1 [Eumeta japonica]|uniref:Uncharacterized protein n=1 Tax=Eumeta variegata TaxID=151549 RepID=A0A4C1WUS8_EUMVA|nr:hypothetical protein EVAR_36862_1 [Eumeta japonica]